ncbi:MAG TPA: energy transducer TonB [Pyrinomonadaceae bacterium]|nr:energy transducer TonB [Pyrinomonadaceae bacterium]
MRRLFFNLFVSGLTFIIGLSASALLSAVTRPDVSRSQEAVGIVTIGCPSTPAVRTEKPLSGGILNNKAISLPKPEYPAVARAARQSGTVTVQVIVDESGKVISARSVSGPPLLLAAAAKAASEATFSPTKLSGKPVKVTGVVTYNFVLQ